MKKITAFCIVTMMFWGLSAASFATESVTCWFPPSWKARAKKAKTITEALTKKSGIVITPRIAKSYPSILRAFTSEEYALVYVGSFVQTILWERALGTPLVQAINGREFYSGILVYPHDEDPQTILANDPEQIAFTVGASSGESSAKAATEGKAAIRTASHAAAAGAVKAGKAKAALVKNWWWEDNKHKFPTLTTYKIPEISLEKNPDYILTATKTIPAEMLMKITDAAIASKEVFGAVEMMPFDTTLFDFSSELMKKGKIDPLTYEWK